MSPTSVGLVLVEGQDADGATMDRDSFLVSDDGQPSQQATAAVLRTEAMAANRGLRLHSIGVTWSEDADLDASMLMESLSESGFDNVVAIRMPEATEALARGVAEVLGYATTAVCLVEPQSAISLIVNTSDGAVQTAFNHAIDSDEDLISWLSAVFTRADWAPEALVVVGSAGDFEPLMHRLEDALSVPVYAPEEAKLALARGAALASAQSTELPLEFLDEGLRHDAFVVPARVGDLGRHRTDRRRAQYRRSLSTVGPAAMLATGVVTFVVSASIAISLQLSPARPAPPSSPTPAAKVETDEAPAAAPVLPPPAAVPPAPVVEAVPPPEAPPSVNEDPPVAVVDTPAEAPVTDQAPAAVPDAPPAQSVDPVPAQTVDPALAPPTDPALAPPVAGPPPVPPVTGGPMMLDPNTQVPAQKPGLWTRIKERLSGTG
ncbi:hypothetical protein H7I40_04000 [Mycolicibacterium madagascariense]|nr:hypothetical protein [Mycolicibacterium madagascariense]MCV7011553.1 hypothetical protein [Mycolicibacterium madagascariense]